jgi:hypothetical protein
MRTDPDLVVLAGTILPPSQRVGIYRQSAAVTGTGPDLIRIADQP